MTVAQLVGLVLVFPLVLKFGNNFGPNRGIDISFVLVASLYLIAAILVIFAYNLNAMALSLLASPRPTG